MSGGEKDLEFVIQMTSGLDRANPDHLQAAKHLLFDVGLDGTATIVRLSSILQMSPENVFMHDTSQASFGAMDGGRFSISKETEDKLIDWLGKRPIMDRHQQKENTKVKNAQEDMIEAKKICQRVQSIIPLLEIEDEIRVDLLEMKYYAVVATAKNAGPPDNHAFLMSEYLFFLDQLLYSHPEARILGKAIYTAWTLILRAHEQDRKCTQDAGFSRRRWFTRMHRGYIQHDPDCVDKVILPECYLREAGELNSSVDGRSPYEWDSAGDPKFTDLLEKVSSTCSNCKSCKEKLLKCASCQMVYFCSKECQTEHWKGGGHKRMCKTWR